MIDIELKGNWLGVSIALERLPTEVISSAVWGQRKVAEGLVKRVKKHINNQDLGWVARAASTISNDPRILVDQEAYYSAIKAWKVGNSYFAGVPANASNARGIKIADYAIVHELGWENIPARPLWGPSFKEMGGKRGVKKEMIKPIFQKAAKLKALGFNVTLGKL